MKFILRSIIRTYRSEILASAPLSILIYFLYLNELWLDWAVHRYLELPCISAGFQILPHVCTLKVDCQLNWKPHPNILPFLPQHSGVASGGNDRSTTPCLATEAEEALVNLLEEKGQGRKTVGGLEIGKIQKWRGLKLKTFASPTPG